jgi:glutamate--cysteine ligase
MDSLAPETLFSSHATSLRMSDIGYTSKVQEKIFLSLNSIEEYCDNLCEMVSTKYPDYTKYNPEQLNDHILQIENEYYAPIRPKNKIDSNLRPVDAIRENGIEYIEVRSLDISPYHPNGIDKKSLYFISLFLHYCLDSDSPPICRDEYFSLFKSWQKIAWQGRDPLLEIELLGGKVSFFNYMETIFKGMFEFVERRLSGRIKIFYSNILKEEYEKLKNPSLLPSSKMENEIKKSGQSFLNWGLERSQMNKNQWLSKSIPLDSLRFLEKEANSSWELAQSFSMNPDSEVKHTKAVKNPCMSSN